MRKRTPAVPFMILSFLSILSVRPALAGPLQQSKNAFRDGDYETAERRRLVAAISLPFS